MMVDLDNWTTRRGLIHATIAEHWNASSADRHCAWVDSLVAEVARLKHYADLNAAGFEALIAVMRGDDEEAWPPGTDILVAAANHVTRLTARLSEREVTLETAWQLNQNLGHQVIELEAEVERLNAKYLGDAGGAACNAALSEADANRR